MTIATSEPDLLSVLQRRRELARAMLELSKEQQTLISQQQFDQLIQLFAKKQRVLEQLTGLAQSFGGLVAHWKTVRDDLDVRLKTSCQQAIDQTEQLLSQIMQLEQSGVSNLAEHRDEAQRRLQAAGHEAETQAATGGAAPAPRPKFLDVSR